MADVDEEPLTSAAKALIRAAAGGDEPSSAEREQLCAKLAEREQMGSTFPSVDYPLVSRRHRRAVLLAAIVFTGSVGALASYRGASELRAWWAEVSLFPTSIPAETSTPSSSRPPSAHLHAPAEATGLDRRETAVEGLHEPAVEHVAEEPTPVPAGPSVVNMGPKSGTPRAPLDVRGGPRIGLELELVAAARDALAERRYADAIGLVQRYRRKFERGELQQEALAIGALAECRAGSGNERARAFVERWPDSLFAVRVQRDCGLQKNVVPDSKRENTQEANDPEPGSTKGLQ